MRNIMYFFEYAVMKSTIAAFPLISFDVICYFIRKEH